RTQKVQELLKEAGKLFYFRKKIEAIELYDQAISLDNNCARAYSAKAIVLHFLKKQEEAMKICDHAINLDPIDPALYYNKVRILISLNNIEEANNIYNYALRLDHNDDSYIYFAKGTALHNLRRYEEAVTSYDESIRLAVTDDNICLLASAHICLGHTLTALDKIEEANIAYRESQALEHQFSFRKSQALEHQFSLANQSVSFDKIDLLSYNTPYVKPVKKEQQNMKDVREKLLKKAQETLEEIYNTIGWGKTYDSKKPAAISPEELESEASTFEEEYKELYKEIIRKIRDLQQKELPESAIDPSTKETLGKTIITTNSILESFEDIGKKEEDTVSLKSTDPFEEKCSEILTMCLRLYESCQYDSRIENESLKQEHEHMNKLLGRICNDLGNICCKAGRLKLGSTAYSGAVGLDNNYESAYVNAITTCFIQGFSIELLSVCKELVKITPPLNRSFAYLLSSVTLKEIGLEEEAKNLLQRFLGQQFSLNSASQREVDQLKPLAIQATQDNLLVKLPEELSLSIKTSEAQSENPSVDTYAEYALEEHDYAELITMVRDGILSNIVPEWLTESINKSRDALIEYARENPLYRDIVHEDYRTILDPSIVELDTLDEDPDCILKDITREQEELEGKIKRGEIEIIRPEVASRKKLDPEEWVDSIVAQCKDFDKLYNLIKNKMPLEEIWHKIWILNIALSEARSIYNKVHSIGSEKIDQAFLRHLNRHKEEFTGYKVILYTASLNDNEYNIALSGDMNQLYADIFEHIEEK
ncbi:MAG: hypothetical protein SFT93_02205, partial [Rickettsiaceae bacterium]|nr:hypothetical protein [Rickettsiaceae bacterium]